MMIGDIERVREMSKIPKPFWLSAGLKPVNPLLLADRLKIKLIIKLKQLL